MVRLRRRGRALEAAGPPSGPTADIQHQIVDALPRLAAMTAREIMTPRVDVVALRLPVSSADVAQAVKESGHSHYPVYRDDLDHLAGVLFVKDLFRSGGEPRLRKPFLVPEGRRVLELLQEMRQRRRAFAVVVDEYGGVEGVLTIKDLVSELVGDLRDEFDPEEEAEVTRIDARRWLVGGQVSLDDLEKDVGVTLPGGEYVTLGGFLFDRFGRIPAEGDSLLHEGWEFRISDMDRRRIASVVVRAPITPDSAGGSGSLDAAGK